MFRGEFEQTVISGELCLLLQQRVYLVIASITTTINASIKLMQEGNKPDFKR